ncbi:SH3 domain-containing protein [Purpureocillium lavendulum]|uniref:SH3 domain-containing protein n=1 Tax=Purpureocillium lavendulum TaxID=1247861 RepID=A0AB34FYC6_9HYPO|nr:SH3 domain-containing protein [Purpureocillium lavendulum]
MVSADRQTIMETNRSLRNIKTELENLLEKGVIDEAVFDQIHAALPDESPLHGPLRTTATSNNASPAPARSSPAPNTTAAPPPAQEPAAQTFQNLNVNGTSPAPPSYHDTPPPNVPNRGKPVLAHARALYRYAASDARDVSFEKDDRIAVHEYMNQDWWMGQNVRTGQEGIFPRNYVLVEDDQQKGQQPYGYPAQPQYGYPQGPPQQQNPYNSSVPPMAVAEGGQPGGDQQQGDNKVGQYGKKFGKKLGNAAIFGAGATIGGNIVNSIF